MMGIKTLSLSLQNSFGSVEGSLLKKEEFSLKIFQTKKPPENFIPDGYMLMKTPVLNFLSHPLLTLAETSQVSLLTLGFA